MNQIRIKQAAQWFSDREQWLAFLELCESKNNIQQEWFIQATAQLRQHFVVYPSPGWKFEAWDSPRDTWWYLTEYGKASVGLGFAWKYDFYLGEWFGSLNNPLLAERLAHSDYHELKLALGPVHKTDVYGRINFVQEGGFAFAGVTDGRIPEPELSWHAGHNQAEFVKQAIAKIERFTKDAQATELLRRLNQEVRQTAVGMKP